MLQPAAEMVAGSSHTDGASSFQQYARARTIGGIMRIELDSCRILASIRLHVLIIATLLSVSPTSYSRSYSH
eukprot:scaffold681467_cov94-Prasinocladus_malaysianus.AAC.1